MSVSTFSLTLPGGRFELEKHQRSLRHGIAAVLERELRVLRIVSLIPVAACFFFVSLGARFNEPQANVGDSTIDGNLTVKGSLIVEQQLDVGEDAAIGDKLRLQGNLEALGRVFVGENLTVNRDARVIRNLDVKGEVVVASGDKGVKIERDKLTLGYSGYDAPTRTFGAEAVQLFVSGNDDNVAEIRLRKTKGNGGMDVMHWRARFSPEKAGPAIELEDGEGKPRPSGREEDLSRAG